MWNAIDLWILHTLKLQNVNTVFFVGAIFICFSILFVVEIEVVRHEETVASSRYVFLKHAVSSRGLEKAF